jgi:hypothetical protein
MLRPTWSSPPIWLISQQLTVGILSDLDYNFNLTPSRYYIIISSDLLTLQIGFHSLQIKQLQRRPPTRYPHPSKFLQQQLDHSYIHN